MRRKISRATITLFQRYLFEAEKTEVTTFCSNYNAMITTFRTFGRVCWITGQIRVRSSFLTDLKIILKNVDLPRMSNYSNPSSIRLPKVKKPDYLFGNPAFQFSLKFRCMQRQQFTNFGTVVFRPPITRSLAFL